MDIHNRIMDIPKSIMDIHKSARIMDIHNMIMYIHNYIPRIRRIGGCYGFTSKPPATRHPPPAMVLTR